MPFNQQMTFPSELTLHSTEQGLHMRMNPIEEIEAIRTKTYECPHTEVYMGVNNG
jgi:sucrose-6-phosphate hydrolase SacC (GH32 family)